MRAKNKTYALLRLIAMLILLGGSMAVAASSLTIAYIKSSAMDTVKAIENVPLPGRRDAAEKAMAETKCLIARVQRQVKWLQARQSFLQRSIFIGAVASVVAGIALLVPVVMSMRDNKIDMRKQSLLACACAGLLIACISSVVWMTSTRAIPGIKARMVSLYQAESPGLEEKMRLMAEMNEKVQSVIAQQNGALVLLGFGACLWPIGIVGLAVGSSSGIRKRIVRVQRYRKDQHEMSSMSE